MVNSQAQARKTHEKIKQSAATLEVSAIEQTDSADRRTELAADRTILAAERTYAAWVRTGLAALASGIGARALLDRVVADWLTRSTGAMLILFAGFCFVAAVWRDVAPSVQPPKPRALVNRHQRLSRHRDHRGIHRCDRQPLISTFIAPPASPTH
jgi:putative membrane protein